MMPKKLFLITAIILNIACHNSKKNKQMPALEVEVTEAKTEYLYDKINFATTIKPLYSATIEPRISGYLENTFFIGGETVKKGQKLFKIDPSQYLAAQLASKAQVKQAEAKLALATSNLERAKPLAKIEAISQMQLDEYQSNYKAAVADLNYANEQLTNSNLNLSYTSISSPISGIIASTEAKEGDYVGVGTKFTTLTSIDYIDTVCLALSIPSSKYFDYVTSKSYDNSSLLSDISITLNGGKPYAQAATYYYTQKSAGEGSSSVVIIVKVANDDLLLKNGMFARVVANIGEKKAVLTIAQKAITSTQGVNSVWVVATDNTVSRRDVTLGDTFGSQQAITSGLKQGEKVLLSGLLKVRNGSKVKWTSKN